MTPQYILEKSLCRPAFCGTYVDKTNLGAYPIAQIRDYQNARSEIENLRWCTKYAEPGYTDPERGILFANWNYFPRDVDSLLENYGYEIEWSDEWSMCDNCYRAVRTQPNSYSWQPSYVVVNECEFLCADCLAEDPTEYLASLEDKPTHALNIPAINPADWGYALVDDEEYENGFHPGQNDNPQTIYKELRANGVIEPILFQITDVGQFDLSFRVWIHVGK